MSPDNQQLDELFATARQACEEGASTSDFEPSFAELLDFIRLNPQCREHALRRFLNEVCGSSECVELLEYCMHELRWPEVKAKALDVIARAEDWRVKSALAHVLEAFADNWPGVEMYDRWKPGT